MRKMKFQNKNKMKKYSPVDLIPSPLFFFLPSFLVVEAGQLLCAIRTSIVLQYQFGFFAINKAILLCNFTSKFVYMILFCEDIVDYCHWI